MYASIHRSGPVLLLLALLAGCASAPVQSSDDPPAAPGGAAAGTARHSASESTPRVQTPGDTRPARVAVLPVVVDRGLAASGAGVDAEAARDRIVAALRDHPRLRVIEDHAAPRHVARYTAHAGCDPFFEADARLIEAPGPVLSPRLVAAPGGRALMVLIAGDGAPNAPRSTTVLVPVLSGPVPEATLRILAAELADTLAPVAAPPR